ncbi:hypothetical protein HAX54_028632, partial [Datura stramonium]|nr:hypothetical protein [Datura stramonium]
MVKRVGVLGSGRNLKDLCRSMGQSTSLNSPYTCACARPVAAGMHLRTEVPNA